MLNTIDTQYPSVAKAIEASNARQKAKAARMSFGGAACFFEAKLKQIIQNNKAVVSENGTAGAYQVFAHMYSTEKYKQITAQALLNIREAIRFNKIYRGYDLNQEIRSDNTMAYIADMRQRAVTLAGV